MKTISRMLPAVALLFFVSSAAHAANDELVQKLKQLGQAIDAMSIHISTAASDAEAQEMAVAVQQAFANGLSADQPDVLIDATQGKCNVTIKTIGWELWSQAENGKIISHGAKIN